MSARITMGVHINQTHMDFRLVKRICKAAEELGFDFVTLMDHFRPFPSSPPKKGNMLECWTTLGALAVETQKIKIGTLVSCASYRNPALLAKMAACLDHISEGRLKFGIGAGNHQAEFAEYGIPFDKPRERIRRLEEAIQIIKKLWLKEEASFTGKYYTIEQAVCNPKPVQQPHPPIIVGGRGEQFTLKVIAQLADGWNCPGSFKDYTNKIEILKRHCDKIGRDMKDIQLSWGANVILSADREKIAQIRPVRDWDRFIEASLVGAPDQCIQKLHQFIDLGVTDFELTFPDTSPYSQGRDRLPSLESMQTFAEVVLPEFQKRI
ncbi:MAG: TIGR03560 family F420-dependent LLM class oxidoreductase [Candidatus Hermodarchaeota archaeon]